MRKMICLILAMAILGMVGSIAQAETKTVAASGGDYTSLPNAMTSFRNDEWGDGNDTILLEDDMVHVLGEMELVVRTTDAVLTIKPATGASPIIAAAPGYNNYVFRPIINASRSPATFVLENLTIIGPPNLAFALGAFRIDINDAALDMTLIVRNCMITANNGSNGPVTDFGSGTAPALGKYVAAMYQGEGNFSGKLDMTFENCTFAYGAADSDGTGFMVRRVAGGADPRRSLTLKNVLIIKDAGKSIQIFDGGPETTVNIQECAIFNSGNRALRLINNQGANNPTVNIEDLVIAATGDTAVNLEGFNGSLTVNRATIISPSQGGIRMEGHPADQGDFSLTDVIIDSNANGFRVQPDNTNVNSIVCSNIALLGSATVSTDNHDDIEAAFAAVYGGLGPISDDPEFASTDLSVLDGVLGWSMASNDLYDVDNREYIGKGTPGVYPDASLGGGTRPTTNVPVELGAFTLE